VLAVPQTGAHHATPESPVPGASLGAPPFKRRLILSDLAALRSGTIFTRMGNHITKVHLEFRSHPIRNEDSHLVALRGLKGDGQGVPSVDTPNTNEAGHRKNRRAFAGIHTESPKTCTPRAWYGATIKALLNAVPSDAAQELDLWTEIMRQYIIDVNLGGLGSPSEKVIRYVVLAKTDIEALETISVGLGFGNRASISSETLPDDCLQELSLVARKARMID
jgi:hypothetical protein